MMTAVGNIFGLFVWICWLIHGIYCCIKRKEVNKIVYMCAVGICVLYYIDKIF